MFLSLFSSALAGVACPAPDSEGMVVDDDLAPDGSAFVLAADDEVVCWWVVDDDDAARVAHRWLAAERHPLRVEALPDGRALFVMSDLRLQVRHPLDKTYRNLDVYLPGVPELVLAHGRRDWLAVTVPRDATTALVLLVDVDRERTLASVALPRDNLALSFAETGDAIWVDGAHPLALSESGISVRGQSPR